MLKRVSIQNFKSLKDVTLDLQKVNLLIGPNNSGKSNFLKALEFMSSDNLVNKNSLKIPYNYLFRNLNDDFPSLVNIRLTFNTKYSSGERYSALLSTGYGDYQVRSWSDEIDDEIVMKSLEKPDHTYLFFVEPEMEKSKVYKIDVNTLTCSYPLLPNNELVNKAASNLVAFLDSIRDKYPDIFYKIQKDISTCLYEFSQIRFENVKPTEIQKKQYGDKTYKILGLFDINLKSTFWADELSEGTLYFLALICIINQPDPPKLLLLEEPEKGIHPRRIWEIMRFIFQLAEEKDIQIILTTHNEHVVNAFASMPEAVFVFEKNEEGATEVKNLKRDIIDVSNKKSEENGFDPIDFTSDLGKSWLYGLIGGVPHENI